MISMIAFWAYFVLAFFSMNLLGCPSWGDGIPVETRGCPNLYKEQKTNVSFYDPSLIEPHSPVQLLELTLTSEPSAQHNEYPGPRRLLMTPGWRWIETETALLMTALNCLAISRLNPVPATGQEKNGFLGLAEYDKSASGGNGDGLITPSDSIFSSLRLWQDRNHNGISEAGELISLYAAGLKTIELNYKQATKEDEYGNYFRYRAKVEDSRGVQLGRWAWDVFLVSGP